MAIVPTEYLRDWRPAGRLVVVSNPSVAAGRVELDMIAVIPVSF